MITVSKQQSFNRWDVLPENIREELVSDVNSIFIWQTCEAEHIPNKKIYIVSKIVGEVLMGFLHPEDMAKEIRDSIGIDIRIATSTTDTISKRVFAPIRADIDRVYNPSVGGALTPKIFEEIHPPIAELIPTSTPAPTPILATTLVTPPPVAIPQAPKQEPAKQTPEKVASLDEFARFGKNVVSAAAPVPAVSPAPAPKPIFLQTESFSRPISNAPDFRVPTIAENVMGERKIFEPLPTRTAVVEFSGMPVPKPAPAPQFSAPKVTVVRYGSENSTGPAMAVPKPESMRTITEITPETLKTVAPVPKAPPQPPFAPLSQIPVPSPVMPKLSTMPAPTTSMPPAPPQPTPQVVRKDYSETGK